MSAGPVSKIFTQKILPGAGMLEEESPLLSRKVWGFRRRSCGLYSVALGIFPRSISIFSTKGIRGTPLEFLLLLLAGDIESNPGQRQRYTCLIFSQRNTPTKNIKVQFFAINERTGSTPFVQHYKTLNNKSTPGRAQSA